jgi:tripartite-type tricarboxylate transporter receptor subunit TctC
VAESGYPGFEVGFYQVMLAPAGLPDPIRATLEREMHHALQSPDLQARLRANSLEPVVRGGDETGIMLKAAAEQWRAVVSSAKIQLD